MRNPLLLSLLLFVASTRLGAADSLRQARHAQALLGPEVWSQIIQVENTATAGVYPRTVHALVFELAGILWFYTDVNGTQSFSLHRGRLAAEKKDFGPLLRDIDPGFRRWTVVADEPVAADAAPSEAGLRNGCFIESYAALRMLVARGAAVAAPRLLSYYAKTSARLQGHTVLAYSVAGHVVVFDPLRPDEKQVFPAALAGDPTRLARAVEGPGVVQARLLPVDLPASPADRGLAAAGERREATQLYR